LKTFFYDFKNREGLYALIKSLDPTKVWRIRVDEQDQQSRDMQEKYHAMINDVAAQCTHLNKKFTAGAWKRLLVADFREDCIANDIPRVADYWRRNDFELVPSLSGHSLVVTGEQTRDWPKYVASAFIEYLNAYGHQNNVVWSEGESKWHSQYSE
jgi:hypothetical protein